MFNFGKKSFLEKNADYLSKVINEPKSYSLQYYKSLEPFELQWGFAKISGDKSSPDCRRIAQSCCEMIIDATLSDPPYVDTMIKENVMSSAMVKFTTAKLAGTLIGQKLFEGSVVENELFRVKFEAFMKSKLINGAGQEVMLHEFMKNPAGGLVISDEAKKALFGE